MVTSQVLWWSKLVPTTFRSTLEFVFNSLMMFDEPIFLLILGLTPTSLWLMHVFITWLSMNTSIPVSGQMSFAFSTFYVEVEGQHL